MFVCYTPYTQAKTKELGLPFGAEYSGHIYFTDRANDIGSGIYAGLRLLEILSNTDKNIEELLDNIPIYLSTPEIKISIPDDIKLDMLKLNDYFVIY